MYKNKISLLLLIVSVCYQFSLGQNNTNSPYTRFGYGNINEFTSGAQRAMGGTGIGGRNKSVINNVNPASYSSIDSMTFMFDFGGSGQQSRFANNNGGFAKTWNGNIEYVSLQFPLFKNTGFSAGLLPYSVSGYNINTVDTTISIKQLSSTTILKDSILSSSNYTGNGGINQIYVGLSGLLFKHLSLGVNSYYMYGRVNNSVSLRSYSENAYSSQRQQSLSVNSYRFRFGAQYFNTFATKHYLSLGAIYESKASLNGTLNNSTVSQVAGDTVTTTGGFEQPQMFGVGLNYIYDNRLTLSLDYSLQQWSKAQFFNKTDSLADRSKIAFGTEYIPNAGSRKYLEKIRYRAGMSISDSYYRINGLVPPPNITLSFGFGFPLKNSKSIVNTTFEYGKMGSTNLLQEDYFKFTVNVVTNEFWFMKRKL